MAINLPVKPLAAFYVKRVRYENDISSAQGRQHASRMKHVSRSIACLRVQQHAIRTQAKLGKSISHTFRFTEDGSAHLLLLMVGHPIQLRHADWRATAEHNERKGQSELLSGAAKRARCKRPVRLREVFAAKNE